MKEQYYFKEQCNPEVYFVRYCKYFEIPACSKTCVYAQEKIPFLEKVIKEDFDY